MEQEEPVTPMGRLCLLAEHNHVINCAIGLKNPVDIDGLKTEILNSIMIKIPRFSSIMTVDPRTGLEHWKKVHVNLDDHIIIHHNNDDYHHHHQHHVSDEDIINECLADMAITSPMRMDKPLWELHIMHVQTCMILRVHHGVADGMSLTSLLWTMGKSPSPPSLSSKDGYVIANEGRRSMKNMGFWKGLMVIWYTLYFGIIFMMRCLWVKDKAKEVSGFTGVEFWPRKVVTARFKISDMKTIKKAIPNVTVHDVLCGILFCGLTRYLNLQYPGDLQDGVQITGLCPFNLRQNPGIQDVNAMLSKDTRTPWGNRFSVILVPFKYMKRALDPLAYVLLAKEMMNKKKQSFEALLSYNVVNLMSTLFGYKVAGLLYYNLFNNTSFLISNIVGPPERIKIDGNPVTFIRVSSSAQPQAITMHMVSYEGWADLQIQVAKDLIHDPKLLAQCFEDALMDMKDAAEHA